MKKIIQTNYAPQAIGPYNQAVEVNGILFTSGQIPINPASGQVERSDFEGQVEQVLENIKAIIETAGYEMEQVVKVNCYLTDLNQFSAMNEIYARYFPENSPARAAAEVSKLPKNTLIEMDAIAIK
ncbi:MAG: RidA family protein [Bacteroidales bacterium]|nr:RidA family protein [Bacteroidales bacterium]